MPPAETHAAVRCAAAPRRRLNPVARLLPALVTASLLVACAGSNEHKPEPGTAGTSGSPGAVVDDSAAQPAVLVDRTNAETAWPQGKVAPAPVSPPVAQGRKEVQEQDRAGASQPSQAVASERFARSQRYTSVRRMIAPPGQPYPPVIQDRDKFAPQQQHPVQEVATNPVSTFSIDVDTGSYALVRSRLEAGQLPPADAVRLEELVNYFPYDDPAPATAETPFAVHMQAAPAPWHNGRLLLRVALKGYDLPPAERAPANLVFLLDVSGSMGQPDKLPLLQDAFNLLVDNLGAEDRVAIVVYAGASGLVLESTPGSDKPRIRQALRNLQAGGSTNGSDGINLAYQVARDHFIKGGSNRVVLATDGDFNVGTVSVGALKDLVARQRASGIALTTLGFGRGNFNDELMEQLADVGNGNYAYIDSLQEGRKVLGEQLGGTLQTIASDVKVQVEFNPARVSAYRLLGYANRRLAREDFSNDKVDAGDIGLGHSVVAFYELAPAEGGGGWFEPLRYGSRTDGAAAVSGDLGQELAMVQLRFKHPGETRSELLRLPVTDKLVLSRFADADDNFRFGVAVAGFAQLLRGGEYTGDLSLAQVAEMAAAARGEDLLGYRAEFMRLARLTATLHQRVAANQAQGTGEQLAPGDAWGAGHGR